MDARKAIAMFTKVNVRTIGVVENMSGFICPDCGSEHDIFGTGGGASLGRELGLEVLGRIPIEPAVRTGGDAGVPITSTQHPSSDDSVGRRRAARAGPHGRGADQRDCRAVRRSARS